MILRERITHKHTLFILSLLISLLPVFSEIKATSRGIHAVSPEGQNLFLYKDYHALVIGISNYDHWPKLPHAGDDAREVADKLKKLGYGVDLILDPAHKDLRDALNRLVYFAGIEFFIKGTPEARVQFLISDRQKGIRDLEHWYFNLKVNDRWKFFRIPFDSLLLNKRVAEYYDTNKILELDKVHKIDWIIKEKQNPKGASGKIWVDEIMFY